MVRARNKGSRGQGKVRVWTSVLLLSFRVDCKALVLTHVSKSERVSFSLAKIGLLSTSRFGLIRGCDGFVLNQIRSQTRLLYSWAHGSTSQIVLGSVG